MREPNPAVVDWRSLAALAHAMLGEHDAAIDLVREELGLARRFGAPRAIGIALRTLGVVGADLRSLEEAVAVLGDCGARLEHARALTDLGVALRHQRRIIEARGRSGWRSNNRQPLQRRTAGRARADRAADRGRATAAGAVERRGRAHHQRAPRRLAGR